MVWMEDETTLYDEPWFQDYCAKVEAILVERESEWPDGRPKGVSIPELHRYLGADAMPRITFDALEWTASVISEGSPQRFRILERPMQAIQYTSYNNNPVKQRGKRDVETQG